MVEPVECGEGMYMDQEESKSSSCEPCPKNTYSKMTNATAETDCTKCEPGKTTFSTGAKFESECRQEEVSCENAGQFPSGNDGTCVDCPAGYKGKQGTKCYLCPRGTYQDEAAALSCKTCATALCQVSPGSISSSKAIVPQGFDFMADQDGITASTNASNEATSLIVPDQHNDINRNPVQQLDASSRNVLMAIFAACALCLLFTHRLWPIRMKSLDILFAGDHYIDDSHAKRMLDSRLGTAFTFMLPFFLGIAVVSIFADDNDLLIKGLEPASSLDPPLPSIKILNTDPEQHPGITKDMLPNLFKRLVFDIATFAPGTFACSDIVVTEPTGAIACERKTVLADQGGDGGAATFCRLSLTCTVGADLRGEQNVAVSFPSAFQNIQWSVQPDAWNGLDIVSKVNHTLMERNHLLTGTATNPTTLSFGLTRSRYRDLRGGLDDTKTSRMYGLQVSWLGETKQLSKPDEPDTADGRHHVVFALDVQESVFESERSDRVNFPTRLGTVLTLMLSAIGIMRVVKALLGLLIDVCLVRRAKKTGHAAPSDVDRRLHILNEKFLTETADMDHHQEETAARRLSQIGSFRQPKKTKTFVFSGLDATNEE
jgi:hypothetical protein